MTCITFYTSRSVGSTSMCTDRTIPIYGNLIALPGHPAGAQFKELHGLVHLSHSPTRGEYLPALILGLYLYNSRIILSSL